MNQLPVRIGGVFDGYDAASRRPVLAPDHPRLSPAERDRVVAYLRGGADVMTTTALDVDHIDPSRGRIVPMSFRTDGYWVWSDEVPYYVETYDLAPEPDLLRHIAGRGYRPPTPDESAIERAYRVLQPPV